MYYICIYITECGRTEINTTKEMSENVVQPGIEPGSPDVYVYMYVCMYVCIIDFIFNSFIHFLNP